VADETSPKLQSILTLQRELDALSNNNADSEMALLWMSMLIRLVGRRDFKSGHLAGFRVSF